MVSGVETKILRKFRHLVELHYRDHWRVSRYAEVLGVDYDRLHRICKYETGRTAAELIHERLTAEAKVRLENSGCPLKNFCRSRVCRCDTVQPSSYSNKDPD